MNGTALKFRRGAEGARSASVGPLLHMPDAEKRQMCLDLLGEFGVVNVQERGDELIHSCCLPFGLHRHGDSSPSAALNWRKLVFNCLGCGNGGGIGWFIAVCRGEDVESVRNWVEHRTSIEHAEGLDAFLSYLDSCYGPKARIDPPMPKFNPAILDSWRWIHPYLTEYRGIPEANIIRHQVGYDSKLDRIIIPHFWHNELVGWQSRRLTNDGSPKYKNTPDFPKDRTIYNYDWLQTSRDALVVESPMSVISKTYLAPLVATFGATVTERQLSVLSQFQTVTLWFDNDEAGWEATYRVGKALSHHCDILVVESDLAADVADLTVEDFQEMAGYRIPYSLWRPPKQLREYMPIRKYASGKVLEESNQKTASQSEWTTEDDRELDRENDDD